MACGPVSLNPSAVSLCIVNYNGERHLPHTLPAAAAISGCFAEVLFVDNGSSDGSIALVERLLPSARIIPLPANQGPGTARNAGFSAATTDRILFMDNDVVLEDDCVAELMRALDTYPGAAFAMPRVLYRHAPDRIQYDGAGSHFLGTMSLQHADTQLDIAPTEVRVIDSLISCCFLFDRSRWQGGTFFDEAFFMYHEDHDLGLRTRLAGRLILSVPAAHCYHGEGSVGLSLRSTGGYQPLRVVGNIRNRWLILLKNYQLRTLLLLSPVLLTYEVFQLAGVVRKRWHREWWQAVTDVAARRREILQQRQDVQRSRRTADRAVLHGGRLPFTSSLASGRLERIGQELLNRICMAYWRGVRRWL